MSNIKDILRKWGLEWFNVYYSIYKGVVVDINDPEKRGRIKLLVPQIFPEVHEYWAESKGIFAGGGIGFFSLPKVGDKVWVTFEQGNPQFPIWEYASWEVGSVIEGIDSNYTKKSIITPFEGFSITFDTENKELRIIKGSDEIVLNEQGVSIKSDNISIGSIDGSNEPATLGDTNAEILKTIVEQLDEIATQLITSTTAYAPLNAAQVVTIGAKATTIKIILATIEPDTIKSNKVTID